jgi:serine/threonine protein kinase
MTEPKLLGDRYEVGKVLGSGGLTEVRRARDRRLGRVVAIKTLRVDRAADTTFQARFRREAQSAKSLNHRNIVAVYDTGEDFIDGHRIPYIVMEYVRGQTLRELLRERARFTPERTIEVTASILDALEYSHRAGIVHLDIKPGNVMITTGDEVKVMGFGIARSLAETGAVVGTAQYISPEQARGESADARSDLYATGCVMYELLTGRPPFVGESLVSVAVSRVREMVTPPSALDPSIPRDLDTIVLAALAKDRLDRYQSAYEMRGDLERCAAGRPVVGVLRSINERKSQDSRQSVRRRDLERDARSRPPRQTDRSAKPPPLSIKRPLVVSISPKGRRLEPIGDEVRLFNNAKSSSTAVETITVRHTSRVSVSVDVSNARTLSGSGGVKFLNVAEAQAMLQNEVARKYSLGVDTELTLEQSTEINVPAHTNVEVVFHWKKVWVRGVASLAEGKKPAEELAEVPFEVTIELTFDKETRDITTP